MENLETKVWYRLVKVLYIFVYAVTLLITITLIYLIYEFHPSLELIRNLLFGIGAVGLIFEAIKQSFFYIATGTLNPEKKLRTSDKPNHKK